MRIAVLLTCHNRREKTVACLRSLKVAVESYNRKAKEAINIRVFLCDDGCIDGTVQAAREVFPDKSLLIILQGDGNLYWAGGMRFCWKEALKQSTEWDYYLLLNDDVELLEDVFTELFLAEQYATKNYGKEGIVSGITCAKHNPKKLTYGGSVWINRLWATKKRLVPDGTPQLCDQTNANILLVPGFVVQNVGIFSEVFTHGSADYDYSFKVKKAGYPVILTAHFCGKCDDDHSDISIVAERIKRMTIKERKAYFAHPLHSNSDYLHLISHISPLRYPIVWIGRKINIYFPSLYYKLYSIRDEKNNDGHV